MDDHDLGAPLIAVTGRRRGAAGTHGGPPSLDALEVDVYFSGYAAHVAAAGGVAVHVPAGTDPGALMDRVDALVLTGGTDVEPARHGRAPVEGAPPSDPVRDAFEVALLDAARARGRPVLAICRGLQLVDVAWGGTLHVHLADHAFGRGHEVTTLPGSVLHDLHGPTTVVNSLHHQGVDDLGAGLRVTARAPDGVVEGVESTDGLLVGVQWHPEQMDAAPQPVFRWLVGAARAVAAAPWSHGATS